MCMVQFVHNYLHSRDIMIASLFAFSACLPPLRWPTYRRVDYAKSSETSGDGAPDCSLPPLLIDDMYYYRRPAHGHQDGPVL